MLEKGYVQIYTGNGKGKTTASLGLALRATGAGYKVFIGQFLKGQHYSEKVSIHELLPNVELLQLGGECFIFGNPTKEDFDMAEKGLQICSEKLLSGKYDVVILDEINVALSLKLLKVADVIKVISTKPEHVELILTGRNAPNEIIEVADLVTEMKEIKHYYKNNVKARVGIEK